MMDSLKSWMYFQGIKEGGNVIINTNNGVETTNGVEINKIDATGIALRYFRRSNS